MMMAKAPAQKNWFAIWISIAVVAVLLVGGGAAIWMNNLASSGGQAPAASNIDDETGAIAFGDGPDVIDTYIDFMCPACNNFESVYGETISGLVDEGKVTLNVHPIAILDRLSQGTSFSTRAANAMYCVAENSPDAAMPFLQAMYQNQPAEQSPGLTDEEIISIAEGAGASDVSTCITDQTYGTFVTAKTKLLPPNPDTGRGATPTVILNGDYLKLTGNPQTDIVDALKG